MRAFNKSRKYKHWTKPRWRNNGTVITLSTRCSKLDCDFEEIWIYCTYPLAFLCIKD